MNITSMIASNLGSFYDYSSFEKAKAKIKENIGRFILSEEVEETLSKFEIEGLDKFSKKEKTILTDFLKDNPYNTKIVEYYNKSVLAMNAGEKVILDIDNKDELLKRLNTLKEFLKAFPYNEPGFQIKAYRKVIDWSISNENGNFDILIKGMNNYVEKQELEKLLSDDLISTPRAIKYIKEKIIIDQEIEKKELTLSAMSSVLSIGLVSTVNPPTAIAATASTMLPKILGYVGATMAAPTLIGLAQVAVGGYAFYKMFELINKSMHEVNKKYKEETILYTKADSLSDLSIASNMVRNKLFKDVLSNKTFDKNNKEQKKYLNLLLYVNEKIDTNVKLPKKLIEDYNLSKEQVKNIENLDFYKIHEISNIKNQEIKKWFLLNEVPAGLEYFYKSLSNAMVLIGDETHKSNSLDKPYIINIDYDLKTAIEKLPAIEKRMINSYISVIIKANGIMQPHEGETLKTLIEDSKDTEEMAILLTERLQTKVQNYERKEIKNKELNYFKRVSKIMTGKEELDTQNVSMVEYLQRKGANIKKAVDKAKGIFKEELLLYFKSTEEKEVLNNDLTSMEKKVDSVKIDNRDKKIKL